jgi:hypothetical protein
MKQKLLKLVTTMLLGGLFSTAYAQKTMDVSGFTREDTDLMARVTKPVRDRDQGKLCALIRVETGLKNLDVRADALGIVQQEEHNGEVWLYVPYGAKSLSFYHEGYFSLMYQYELPIEEGVVYKLRLKSYDTPPTQGVATQTQLFVLTHNPDEATVIIDDMEVPTENGVFAAMMSKGEHHYIIKASKYDDKEGDFILADQPVRESVSLKPLFGTFQLRTLPEDDFDVFINGQLVGSSPFMSERLDPGSYRVHIAKEEYYPVDTIVRLREGDNLKYRVKLTSYEDSAFYKRILGGRDISFGVNIGYVFPFVSSTSSGDYTGSPINYSLGDSRENVNYFSQSGFTAGVFADIRLYNNLYLVTGVNYTYIKYKNKFNQLVPDAVISATQDYIFQGNMVNDYEESYTHNFIEIPIMASYRFVLTRKASLHLNVGPYINYGLSSKLKLSGSSEANCDIYQRIGLTVYPDPTSTGISFPTHLSAEFDLYSDQFEFTNQREGIFHSELPEKYVKEASPYNRFNYGLKAGINYELRGFQLGITYGLQLSNMGKKEFWEGTRIPIFNGQTGTNNMSGYKHRIHTLEIKLGYVFRY